MGNICSDLGDRKKSASISFVDGPSSSKENHHQQQYRLIEPIGSSTSTGQTASVNPTDRIVAGSSNVNDDDDNNNNNKKKMENIHRPVLLTSTPPIPSTFHRLLDYSKRYVLSFVKDSPPIDFAQNDYRAFCLLVHRQHGAIMLHCTRKKKKPPHYQLPGGHVDKFEFDQVRQTSSSSSSSSSSPSLSSKVTVEELYQAARIGCAREVYEETGLDFRSSNGSGGGGNRSDDISSRRFRPLVLYTPTSYEEMQETRRKQQQQQDSEADPPLSSLSPLPPPLINEYKHRLFFICEIYDEDFDKMSTTGSIRYKSLPQDFSCDLTLLLSVEHSAFIFEKDPRKVVNELKLHSGGKVQHSVEMALVVAEKNEKQQC